MLLFAHCLVLALNNLPWCPLVERLYPWYSWYPQVTGQIQGWAMYRLPAHEDARYAVVAQFADGSSRTIRSTFSMDDRELYLLESFFFTPDGTSHALAYLDALHARWKDGPRPVALSIARSARAIPPLTASGPAAPFAPAGLFRKSFP